MERWYGKVAIVTGAGAGIGAGIAERLVKEGLKVAGFDIREDTVEELSKKLRGEKGQLYARKLDITKENEVVEAFKWVKSNLGPIHVLVNNAGGGRNTNLIDGDYQKWREVVDLNVMGLCIATREAVRDMKANNVAGHIIHINSHGGHKVTFIPPELGISMNVYNATKFAVTALTETLRQELNNNNLKIKITSISPGSVRTNFGAASGYGNALFRPGMPLLEPADIADTVRYVLSTPPHVQVHELLVRPVGDIYS